MSARFRFTHETRVAAPVGRVHEVLVDLERYPRWWPQVRAVARLDDDRAVVVCRSALPYDLELVLTARERGLPTVSVGIAGQLAGTASWTLSPSGTGTELRYLQEVEARGWLRGAAYLARPVLVWNHRVMMRGFDAGLARALAQG